MGLSKTIIDDLNSLKVKGLKVSQTERRSWIRLEVGNVVPIVVFSRTNMRGLNRPCALQTLINARLGMVGPAVWFTF